MWHSAGSERDQREIEGILEDRVFAIFKGAIISMDAVDIRLTFDDESWDGKVFVQVWIDRDGLVVVFTSDVGETSKEIGDDRFVEKKLWSIA